MSQYQNQYAGGTPQVDEYGNPIRVDEHGPRTHTDQYGNPTHNTDTRYGTGGSDSTTLQGLMHPDANVPTHGGDYRHDQQGLTQQMKEKIPGVGLKHDDPYQQSHTTSTTNPYQQGHTTSTTAPGYYEGQHNQEKKGLTEKVKENMPGVGRKHDDPYQQGYTTSTTNPYQQGHTTSTTAPGYYEGQHHQEKKGLTENIPGVGRKHDDPYQQSHTTSTTNPYQQGHTTSTIAPGNYEGQHNQEKKGLTEKIKENIPCVGRKQDDPYQQSHTTSTTAPGYYEGQQHQEKKGVMEKIKERLPGHR
ncbi:hypothetical protein ACB092_02G157800 [Castanea dentata]